jgi:hypothetical protein
MTPHIDTGNLVLTIEYRSTREIQDKVCFSVEEQSFILICSIIETFYEKTKIKNPFLGLFRNIPIAYYNSSGRLAVDMKQLENW